MPRKQPTGLSRFFRRLIQQTFQKGKANADRNSQRRLKFESLEGRQLLASDLASLTGVVSVGGSPVDGATVNLYVDDGDSLFEPGADDGAATPDTTDVTGTFRFDQLTVGTYWLEQPAQTVGAVALGQFVRQVTISAAQADGTAGTVFDDFGDSPPVTVVADGVTNPNSLAADHAGAIGGERDMIVTLTGGTTTPSVTLTSTGNQLIFDSSFDAQGQFNVIYDGNDSDANALAATGLAAQDLTQAGANSAVKVRAQADQAGATVRLRVYTDAVNFSDSAAVVIPGTNTAEDIVFHFAEFSDAGGTGADFANVGAIDLLIDTNTNATDGLVTLLGAFAATTITENITNEADLSVTKTVDDAAPAVGEDVTFTITVANAAGGIGATGVEVTDLLPTGLDFVGATPSGSTTYNETTGLWTIGALAAGDDATLTIVATVTSGAAIDNTAAITASDQADSVTANDTDTVQVDAVATANLSLTKTVDEAAPDLGSDVTFTLTLSNAGPDAATGVVVTDLLPAGLDFVSATPSGSTTYDDATGIWTIGTVNNAATATLTIVATATGVGPLDNLAEVTAVNEADPNSTPNNGVPAEDDRDSVTVDAVSADLSLELTVDDPAPNVGDDVTYTLTLTNGGPDAATGVEVTDLLPAGLDFVSATPSGSTTYNETTGLWTIGTVNSAGTATLTIVATVVSSAAIDNTAEVTAADLVDPDSTPGDGAGDDFDSALVDAAAAADLSLAKDVDDLFPDAGEDVTFTIVVTNDGPDQATGVVVTDLLPTGLDFVSATPSGATTYDDATGLWTIGAIADGATATLSIVATVSGTLPLVNTAEVTAVNEFDPDSTPDDDTGDDFATVTITAPPTADLSLDLTVDNATPNLGQDVTYTITLANGGPDAATGIEVTDLLPAGLTFVGATPSTGAYDEITGLWTIPTLAGSANATLTIVATVNSTAAIANTAEVTASSAVDPDSTPDDGAGDDFDTVSIDAPAAADLSLTQTVSSNTPSLGSDVTITLTLANAGPDAATGVLVTDLLPAGLTFVSATPSGATTYDQATGVWTVGSVNSGANATLSIVATVTSGAAIVNSAQVTTSAVFDPDSTPGDGVGDDFDTETIDAPAAADLSLVMVPSSATPALNSDVTFTLTLTNSGPDPATGVQVTDLLPAGLTFVSATPSGTATYNQTTGLWDIGTVAASGTATLTIVATVTSSTAITNVAEVTASGVFDPDSTPNDGAGDDRATATVDALGADLSVTITPSSTTPNFGSNVTYTITVANGGPDQAAGVVVTDLLPAGLVFVSSTPSQGSYVAGTGLWTVGSIASGANATLTLVARVNTTAAVENVAQVTASGVADPDSTPNDNTGDDRFAVTIDAPAAADLRLAKSSNAAFVNAGQNATFTVTLSNDGPDQATNVAVTDLLPSGLAFVSATPSQGTYNNTTGVWTVGSVNNGASVTLQIVATLTTAGSQTNVAQVTASDQFDPDSTPGDNTGDDRATVQLDSSRLSKRRFLAR
ncbi:MAG: DUF11 domain-containing protein [Pirellulaceae bacterium]